MNYEFPIDIKIEEVREAIKDKPEFIEAVREGYRVFNYNVNFADTFPPVVDRKTAILRELRGLIFYNNGEIASRRFQKFFNLNERAETLHENIDWSKPHWVMEKLDGSMVTPFISEDAMETKWFSKMGETFVSEQVSDWLNEDAERKLRYEDFAFWCYLRELTPIFEWCTPKNRIVVAYPESRLVLTAIRSNYGGEYMPPEEMANAKNMAIDVVKFYSSDSGKTLEYIASLDDNETDEGFVIRFEDGHMAKVKSAWYIQLHKVKSYLDQEKDVAKLILENNIDDLLSVLDEVDVKRIEAYSLALEKEIENRTWDIKIYVDDIAALNLTKKDYALEHGPKVPSFIRNVIFRHFDRLKDLEKPEIEQIIIDYLLTKTNTNAKFLEAKKEIGMNLVW